MHFSDALKSYCKNLGEKFNSYDMEKSIKYLVEKQGAHIFQDLRESNTDSTLNMEDIDIEKFLFEKVYEFGNSVLFYFPYVVTNEIFNAFFKNLENSSNQINLALQNKLGETCLHSQTGYLQTVFMTWGCFCKEQNVRDYCDIDCSSQQQSKELEKFQKNSMREFLIKPFMKHRFDFNIQDNDGNTVFHSMYKNTLKFENFFILDQKFKLEFFARFIKAVPDVIDITLQDNEGKTLCDLAKEYSDTAAKVFKVLDDTLDVLCHGWVTCDDEEY